MRAEFSLFVIEVAERIEVLLAPHKDAFLLFDNGSFVTMDDSSYIEVM